MNTSTTTNNKKEGNTPFKSLAMLRQDIRDLEEWCGQGNSCNCSYQQQAKAFKEIIKNRLNEPEKPDIQLDERWCFVCDSIKCSHQKVIRKTLKKNKKEKLKK